MKPLRARITVMERKSSDEVKDKYKFPAYFKPGICEKFQDGQVFVADLCENMPEGFPCRYAWESLLIYHPHLIKQIEKLGATEGNMQIVGTEYPCCVDGLKPITFELTLLNQDEE